MKLKLLPFLVTLALTSTALADLKITKNANQLQSIKLNGAELLAGNGVYLIGSVTGSDVAATNYHSYGSSDGKMVNDKGAKGPAFSVQFTKTDDTTISFDIKVGPMPFKMNTLSVPFDLLKEQVTSFGASQSQYVDECAGKTIKSSTGKYSDIQACHDIGIGLVGVAIFGSSPSWGEVKGPFGSARVSLSSSSHYTALRFHRHPLTHNLELSFGLVTKDETASVKGTIKLTPSGSGGSPSPWKFEAESDLAHQIGKADSDGWSAGVSDAKNKYLAYGPYTTAIPAGARTATFSLLLDNVTADDNLIATIDVFDAAKGKVLASSGIKRKSFPAPFKYKDFGLNVTVPSGAKLEFRVYYHGGSYIRLNNVIVK